MVADAAKAHGLDVVRLVADVDLDTGQSMALPVLRQRVRQALSAPDGARRRGHAAPGHRNPDVRCWPDVLCECAEEAGKPVVASFTGVLDLAERTDGLLSTGDESGAGTESAAGGLQRALPCFCQPGSAVDGAGRRRPLRRMEGPRQGRVHRSAEGTDPAASQQQIDDLLAGVTGTDLLTPTSAQTARLLGRYGITVQAIRRLRPTTTRRWPRPSGSAGPWR